MFKYSCLHFSPTPIPTSHPRSYPSLALSTCPLYVFLDDPFSFPPIFPLLLPSGYCQFVLISVCLVIFCLSEKHFFLMDTVNLFDSSVCKHALQVLLNFHTINKQFMISFNKEVLSFIQDSFYFSEEEVFNQHLGPGEKSYKVFSNLW